MGSSPEWPGIDRDANDYGPPLFVGRFFLRLMRCDILSDVNANKHEPHMFISPHDRNERRLKYALIGLGATLIFALLSALYFDFTSLRFPGSADKSTSDTVLSTQDELKLQEVVAPLIASGDMKTCEQIDNAMYRSVCVNNIALKKAEETNDITYCRYLDGDLIPEETCEQQVVFRKSIDEGNTNACAETKNDALKRECEDSFPIRLALEKNDPSLCDRSPIPSECRDIVALGRFSADPKSLDCASFSTEDAKTDCSSLRPLFLLAAPDIAKLRETCTDVKSPLFARVCSSLGVAALTPAQP